MWARPFRSARRDLPSAQGLFSRVHSPFQENTYLAPHGSAALDHRPIQGAIALEYQTSKITWLISDYNYYVFLLQKCVNLEILIKKINFYNVMISEKFHQHN